MIGGAGVVTKLSKISLIFGENLMPVGGQSPFRQMYRKEAVREVLNALKYGLLYG
jgi:hypothetical protein